MSNLRHPPDPAILGSGLDVFYKLLKEFRGLSVAGLGTAAAVPFVAYLADVVPPWPKGIILVTALVELVTLIVVFQFLSHATKTAINKAMAVCVFFLALFGSAYLLAFSLLTYANSAAKTRGVKGFICRADNPPQTMAECPLVSVERLRDASYSAELIWQGWTVDVVRFGIAMLWLVVLLLLTAVVGSFLVHQ